MGVARANGANCIDDSALAVFAEGLAGPSARARVEQHAAACGDCRAVIAGVACALDSREEPLATAAAVRESTGSTGEELAPHTRVGRYVIERPIGSGAMGAVYAARDPDLGRIVAVKLLRADSLSEAERGQTRARLLREAKAMARLSHPEVITVYDVGAFGDQLFVAMEHVDGGTLRQWRSERHRSCSEILAVYERAGSGLAAAHEAGLVHRDVKPDNVLIGRDGRVRVTDFGLARALDTEGTAQDAPENAAGNGAPTTTLTGTGALLGTPAYMAPEQLRGQSADARSDVFGFCVSLYEALYGERPFAGRTVLELRLAIERGRFRAAPVMTRVPGWVRATLLRGLRPAPNDRFPSMRELLDALRAGKAQRLRRVGAAGFVAVLILVLVVGTLVARGDRATRAHSTVTAATGQTEGRLGPAPLPSTAIPALDASRGTDGSVERLAVSLPEVTAETRDATPRVPHSAIPRAAVTSHSGPGSTPRVGNNGAFILE